MSSSSLLLRGGIVLQHDAHDHVKALADTDILISGSHIEKVGPNLDAVDGSTQVIDCKGKIISPGFIDTHHHVWQTQLKGRHADDTFFEYMPTGNMQSYNYTPQDILWGELGGCLEALDAGTTTVVDHSHMAYSPDHGSAAISATIASGIRSFFCYGPIPRLSKWDSSNIEPDMDYMPPWLMSQIEDLSKKAPFNDGLVNLGFSFDGFFLPKDMVVGVYETIRALGVKLITTHFTRLTLAEGMFFQILSYFFCWKRPPTSSALLSSSGHAHQDFTSLGNNEIPEQLQSYSLLGPDILLSHASNLTASQVEILTKGGAHMSCTPDTESHMSLGPPLGLRPDVFPIASLGIDCHSSAGSSMLEQMRLVLSLERNRQNEAIMDQGKYPKEIKVKTVDAFNLATIKGARAVGMDQELGSIAEGKLADLVVFDAETPSMTCAAQHDPLVAVVKHASTREIDTVIVGGKIRKAKGQLVDVDLSKGFQEGNFNIPGTSKPMAWKEVHGELIRSREEIQARLQGSSVDAAKGLLMGMWHIKPEVFA